MFRWSDSERWYYLSEIQYPRRLKYKGGVVSGYIKCCIFLKMGDIQLNSCKESGQRQIFLLQQQQRCKSNNQSLKVISMLFLIRLFLITKHVRIYIKNLYILHIFYGLLIAEFFSYWAKVNRPNDNRNIWTAQAPKRPRGDINHRLRESLHQLTHSHHSDDYI